MDIQQKLKSLPTTLKNKGLAYYQQGLVSDCTYDEVHETFDAVVIGSFLYQTSITFKGTDVDQIHCNCPVEGLCKHGVAVMYYIKNNLDEFPEFENMKHNDTAVKTFINLSNIYDETFKFHQSSAKLVDVIEYAHNFKFNNQMIINFHEFHYEVYELFHKLKSVIREEYIKLYINTYLQTFLNRQSSIVAIKNTLRDQRDLLINELYYESIILNKIDILYGDYTLIKERIKQVAEVIEKYRRFDILMSIYDDSFFNEIALYIKKDNTNLPALHAIFNYLNHRGRLNFDKLLIVLSKDEAKFIFGEMPATINMLEDALYYKKIIDKEIDYKGLEIYYEEALQHLEEIKFIDLNNFMLYLEKDLNTYGGRRRLPIADAFKLLQKLDYEFDYEHNYMHIYYGHKLGFRYLKNTVLLANKGLPKALKAKFYNMYYPVDTQSSHGYEAFLHLDEATDKETLYIFDFNTTKSLVMAFEIEDENIDALPSYNFQNQYMYLRSFFATESSNDIDTQYQNIREDLSEVRDANYRIKLQSGTHKLIDELVQELQDDIKIQVHEKVDVEIILGTQNMYIHQQVYKMERDTLFGLKVGIGHKYFVKSLNKFLSLVEDERSFSYGVKLAFNHHIENFTLHAQKVITILESMKGISPIKNNEGGLLSQKKSIQLLTLLKGRFLHIQGFDRNSTYHIVKFLEHDFKVEFELHRHGYTLNLVELLEADGRYIFIYKESDVLIDLNNKTMQFLAYDNVKVRKMVHFLLENEDFDIEYAMPKLISHVIPLISEDVQMDEVLKLEVDSQKLEIESYFDFDDGLDEVSVINKFYRNENLLDNVDIEDVSYKKYLNVLSTFGFEDFKITNQKDILVFLNADIQPFKVFGKVYQTTNILNKQVVKKLDTKVSVSLVDGMIKTHIESKVLDHKHLKKVLEAYRLGKTYILIDGNVILLQTEEISNLKDFMEQNEISLDKLHASEKPIYEVFKLDNQLQDIDIQIEDKLKNIIKDIVHYKSFELERKPSMYPLLKNYQIDGLKWLHVLAKHNLGGILADEMGLGKTLQIISFLESSDFKLSMVVCPKSLIYNWAHELEKFDADIKPIIISGTKDARDSLLEDIKHRTDKTLIIISYETLRNDIEAFKDLDIHTLILDEAQHIKSSSALKTKAVKMLRARHKFILTGTPIENSIFDLWSMFDFVMPGYLYTANKFKKLGDKVHESDKKTMDFLIKKTQPFILRRKKQDVLKELPKKIEEIIYATFDGAHKEIYDAYLLKVKEKLEDDDVSKFDILGDLTRLRQLCISPKLIYDNYTDEHIKLDVIYDLIKEAVDSGHKVLVFSSFVRALHLLKDYFDETMYYMLTGDTPAQHRMDMSTDFNKNQSDKKLFLISLKAGGTGLNLTGADVVIHMDPWWNLAAENQASDRAHRIGQKRSVTVYKVVMKDSIEEKIILLQNKKRDLFDQMIEHKVDIEKLDSDDYKFILS